MNKLERFSLPKVPKVSVIFVAFKIQQSWTVLIRLHTNFAKVWDVSKKKKWLIKVYSTIIVYFLFLLLDICVELHLRLRKSYFWKWRCWLCGSFYRFHEKDKVVATKPEVEVLFWAPRVLEETSSIYTWASFSNLCMHSDKIFWFVFERPALICRSSFLSTIDCDKTSNLFAIMASKHIDINNIASKLLLFPYFKIFYRPMKQLLTKRGGSLY